MGKGTSRIGIAAFVATLLVFAYDEIALALDERTLWRCWPDASLGETVAAHVVMAVPWLIILAMQAMRSRDGFRRGLDGVFLVAMALYGWGTAASLGRYGGVVDCSPDTLDDFAMFELAGWLFLLWPFALVYWLAQMMRWTNTTSLNGKTRSS
ncbi:MAG TPA: hypothetical protein VG889_04725 [Rhizomicrobium sp.]|nr:hypothetical protein [Rhizomicrobium sp.]